MSKKIDTVPAYTNRYIVAMFMNTYICCFHIHEQIVCHGQFPEQTEEWERLPNEALCALYFSPNFIQMIKSRRMRWVGHMTCPEDRRGACSVLWRRPNGKRPLGRPRRGREDRIFKKWNGEA
jgi:hypothetical protein